LPELPEVETIRRDLESLVLGSTIVGVEVFWPGSIAQPSVQEFEDLVTGRTILRFDRRGKYLIFVLSGGWNLIVHLAMTGRLLVNRGEIDKHTRAVFHLEDGCNLPFVNMRKFGRLYLVKDAEEVVGRLGPEPLAAEFTPQLFAHLLTNRRGALKPLLLNQRFLAGLGNIYTDEALFVAGLHPQRRADTLNPEEVGRLCTAIRLVLKEGLRDGGTTLEAYRRPNEEKGRHQERLQVFRRTGGPCPRCGATIERIVLGGRGTYFCPRCQR
jgi:formamidopyrimidine-DNA glycosylase